jgi:O-methyltransferase
MKEKIAEVQVLLQDLQEQRDYRRSAVTELITLFEALYGIDLGTDALIVDRLARVAGTTLLEAAFILKSIVQTRQIPGDWCEYGVAHGRTSALLAQVMLKESSGRTLWLYDSFEGLPAPHSKDVMLNDFYGKGSMAAYEGMLCFPEEIVRDELASVQPGTDWFRITKGWITAESLQTTSPERIAFAYLDMDFYQSTLDVLNMLVERMPAGGIAVIDDYGVFSEGVRTAVSEVMSAHPGAFSLENPFNSKFAVMTRL